MYEIEKTNHFDTWLRKIKDLRAKAKVLTRIKRIELGNLGDHKSLGGGLCELRIAYGPGYRVYLTRIEDRIILLLVGGDKSTQSKDIAKAKNLIRHLGEQE